MSETNASIYIFQSTVLIDMDIDAVGGDFDGEAYRYELTSGTLVWLGIDGGIRVQLKGGDELFDTKPRVKSFDDFSTNSYVLNGTDIVLISDNN